MRCTTLPSLANTDLAIDCIVPQLGDSDDPKESEGSDDPEISEGILSPRTIVRFAKNIVWIAAARHPSTGATPKRNCYNHPPKVARQSVMF
jgi:hypothetical protein